MLLVGLLDRLRVEGLIGVLIALLARSVILSLVDGFHYSWHVGSLPGVDNYFDWEHVTNHRNATV